MAISPNECLMSPSLPGSGALREPGPTGLGKKRTLSLGAISRSDLLTIPSPNVLASALVPTTPTIPGLCVTPSSDGGLSSALSHSLTGGGGSLLGGGLSGGLSAALRSHSAMPRIAVGEVDASGASFSPLSSTTPLSRTPTEAVPMPRRKYPKQAEGDVAGSAGSQVLSLPPTPSTALIAELQLPSRPRLSPHCTPLCPGAASRVPPLL